MNSFILKHFPFLIFFVCFLLISWLVLNYPIAYGGGDNYVHYKMARYAWKYPPLFLDHWGKPLYTILSSPFALLGYPWAKLFNIAIGMFGAWLTYLSARELNYPKAWVAIPVVCFSPIYFVMFNTTMTEPLGGCMVILSLWLILKNNTLLSSLLISFLPLSRPDGILWILLMAVYLIYLKKLRHLPLLLAGSLLFSMVGWVYHYHDFFWLINKNPYSTDSSYIYGKGPLLHFISHFELLTGYAVTLFFLVGLVLLLTSLMKNRLTFPAILNAECLFILAPVFLFVLIHSMLWWLGTGYSVGELRVIAIIIPLVALLAIKGFGFLWQKLHGFPILRLIFLVIGVWIFQNDIRKAYAFGYRMSETDKVIREACDWIKKSEFDKYKIYYYDHLAYILLEKNPYDSASVQERLPDVHHPERKILPGSVVIWDAHFGPNEGRVPLNSLVYNPYFRLLNLFTPKNPFTVLGGHNYEVYVFQRQDSLRPCIYTMKHYDFETPPEIYDSAFITKDKAWKGVSAYKLSHEKLFSPTFSRSVGDLRKDGVIKITASAQFYPLTDPDLNKTALVISFERDTSYSYNSMGFEAVPAQPNAWNPITLSCLIPETARDDDMVKIYFYQPGPEFIYIDEFKIEALTTSAKHQ